MGRIAVLDALVALVESFYHLFFDVYFVSPPGADRQIARSCC